MSEENKMTIDEEAVAGADLNGDGHASKEEMAMHLEFKRKEMEDQDAQYAKLTGQIINHSFTCRSQTKIRFLQVVSSGI